MAYAILVSFLHQENLLQMYWTWFVIVNLPESFQFSWHFFNEMGSAAHIKKIVFKQICRYAGALKKARINNNGWWSFCSSLKYPVRRWDFVRTDHTVQFRRTFCRYDAATTFVALLMERLHLITTHTSYGAMDAAQIFINQMICLRGILDSATLEWDVTFKYK